MEQKTKIKKLKQDIPNKNGISVLYNTSIVDLSKYTSLNKLHDYRFYSNKILETVILPESITYIGSWVFDGCTSLTNIYFNGTSEQWNNISKSSTWAKNISTSIVHCSDGDVEIGD